MHLKQWCLVLRQLKLNRKSCGINASSFTFGNNLLFRRSLSACGQLDLRGIYPPITTPFDRSEGIAWEGLKSNLQKWDNIPFRGYVVLGSTGEAVFLSYEERVKVVQFVAQTASDGKLVIAGSGCESTKDTIEMTQRFAEAGAHAVLVVSPSFYKGRVTDDALYSHYTKVADSSRVPVILYNVPANTNVDLGPSLITKLADHPNIIGIKDSGGDIAKIAYVVHKTSSKDFQVVAGSAGFLYPAFCVGCVGGILALANPLGGPLCDLHQLFLEGKHSEARSLQHRVIGPNLAVTKWFGIPGVKKAMELLGYHGGLPRSPLQPLTQSETEALVKEFRSNGFL